MKSRTPPDRVALEIAHSQLKSTLPLDEMLKSRTYSYVLSKAAMKHIRNRERFDIKKMQANDND